MSPSLREDLDVPGTERLVDVNHDLNVAHAGSDIILIPQPTSCGADPLRWARWKKYWQLFLVSFYACAFSFAENNLGAAWTSISEQTHVSITDLNGGGALNYLLLGFVNIFWIPIAMKFGRRLVFLATTAICLAGTVWTGSFNGTGQWFGSNILSGIGTAAYEAVIQLVIFDIFFAHQRGRMLAVYIFGQQLGSIIGLITGGYICDTVGWRWSQYICAIINAVVLLSFFFTFDETMFPRWLTAASRSSTEKVSGLASAKADDVERNAAASLPPSPPSETSDNKEEYVVASAPLASPEEFSKRPYLRRLKPWVYYPQDHTTYWQYFKRPFFLFAFPNILISGIIFAFGCTAGIVSFNTISEIMTEPPYNWKSGPTGLLFLAALVGSIVGWATGLLSDHVVIWLARRNNGIKEPEMRLWTLSLSVVYAALGYQLYGWGAEQGLNWFSIAFGIGAMIAQQVSATSIATAYAMDCFSGISGELVVVLALCSSCINFAISYSTQPFLDRVGYGWLFFFYGILVVLSNLAAFPVIVYGKAWRKRCMPRYQEFLGQRVGYY
ncbi:MFS general substrate transporter [Xylona heveae TC161]|uniref:MFS general substrate transporter n=1 Tax=Xylona heveae (strain CBS 132557 / TC161) TaxID=1328760 RepID=A0A165AG12_XYLHT|nr:MFS general substrate transporter [Xylona heveae TC161]KZF20415.1 MFS general substrate transporter [Xylona heveae TC161]